MKVIINADDLGKSLEVNCAIEHCIKQGLITSTTIMAGGDAFDDAVRIAKSYPQISFGVHLTLDDGDKSLTKSTVFAKEGMTDEDGHFIRYGINGVSHYSHELKEAIYYEWTAQIQKLKDAGVNISHVDSHHHNHTILPLKKTLMRVLCDNNIKCVRLSQIKTLGMYWHRVQIHRPVVSKCTTCDINYKSLHNDCKHNEMHMLLNTLRRLVWTAEIKRNFSTVDFFCSYLVFLKNKDKLCTFFRNGTLELMCHPGHPDYEEETEALEILDKDILKTNYLKI